jgi:hypothetical protein
VVHGLSMKMSDMIYNLGGSTDYWYCQARTMPYAPAAGDALDHEIAMSIVPASASNLAEVLGISFEGNGLKYPDPNKEQLAFWAGINWEQDVAIRGALLLLPSKFTKLNATLKRYHKSSMCLMVHLGVSSILHRLDVATSSSRKEFIYGVPAIELAVVNFSITQIE